MISRTRGARMHISIGLVFELACAEPVVSLGKLDRFVDHAESSFISRSKHHFGTQESHQLSAFDAKGFGHRDHQRLPFLGAHHGKTYSGVAMVASITVCPGLSFPDRSASSITPSARRSFTEPKGCLNFHEEVDTWRCQLADFHDRRVADGLKNIFELAAHLFPVRCEALFSEVL
jgi:hypothetical protein